MARPFCQIKSELLHFKLSGGHSSPAMVKRSSRSTSVAKLPDRGPATKKIAIKSVASSAALPAQPRKVAAGGGDDWEEF